MKQQFLGLAIAAVVAIHGEAWAAPMFVEGPVARAGITACSDGGLTTLVAGYLVDPVLETPAIGQTTTMLALAHGNASCGDNVTIEFALPAGAHFDTSQPVLCTVIKSDGTVVPLDTRRGTQNSCPQMTEEAVQGRFRGRVFGRDGFLHQGETFDVRVSIVFDAQLDDAPLSVAADTLNNGIFASVLASAPFQPVLNPAAIGDDIALLGSSAPGLPVAFSNDDGTFTVNNRGAGAFPDLARTPGVQRLTGDFNGDGLTDYALVGGASWQSIPVALSNGNGMFTFTNFFVGDFANLFGAATTAKALTGDFNHDGHTDIALVGGSGFTTIPVAFSTGGGTFNVTNQIVPLIPQLATLSGARPMVGDYNKDGFADIALVGGAGMNTIPIAFSFGNGQFSVTNQQASGTNCSRFGCTITNFPFLAQMAGAQIVTGDFNADGYTDFAMTASPNASGIVVALNLGFGQFLVRTSNAASFPASASIPGAKLLTGDFNHDGYTDLVLVGGANMISIPIVLSTGFGNFQFNDILVPGFASWAATPGVRAVTGDYNGDGYTDIALVGGAGWNTIPVAKSIGFGAFTITNNGVHRMPAWAAEPNTTAFSGHTDWN